MQVIRNANIHRIDLFTRENLIQGSKNVADAVLPSEFSGALRVSTVDSRQPRSLRAGMAVGMKICGKAGSNEGNGNWGVHGERII